MIGKDWPPQTTDASAVQALSGPREQARLHEIGKLARQGDGAGIAQLVDALTDTSWRVRRAAAEALASCPARAEALRAVLEAMRSKHQDLGLLNGILVVLNRTHLDVGPALCAFLTDPDPHLRIYVAQALGERGDPAVVPDLLRVLGDPDLNVRCQVIEALGLLRSAAATDALMSIVEAREFATAWPALDALGLIGDARIAPRLVPLLQDDLLGEAAVAALEKLGDEEAIPALVAALAANRHPAARVARALAAIHDRYHVMYGKGAYIAELARRMITADALRALLDASDAASPADAPFVARVLGWLDGELVLAALLRLFSLQEARREAGDALVHKGAAALPAIAELLHGDDLALVRHAVELFGRIGNNSQTPALLALLADDDLAAVTAGALAMTGDVRAYQPVSALLGHPRGIIRQAAVAAINSIADPRRVDDLQLWLRDRSPLVRESALKVACYLGCTECLEAIVTCCRDEDEQVRKTAIENIVLMEDARTPEILASALGTDAPAVRAAAARALAGTEDPGGVHLLIEALGDADVWVRYYAAKSIARQGEADETTIEALAGVIHHDSAAQVRVAAVEALGRLRSERTNSLLREAAQESETDLAQAALMALGESRQSTELPLLIAALGSEDPAKRLTAIRAMGRSGLAAATEHLCRVVHSNDPVLAAAAIEALGALDDAGAVGALVELLVFPRWRETCTNALVRVAKARVNWIAGGLEHQNIDVRRTVVEVLGRTRSRDAREAVSGALSDPEPAVRHVATNSLAHWASPDWAE